MSPGFAHFHGSISTLLNCLFPLSLLTPQKLLQNANLFLKSAQPRCSLFVNLLLIVTQFRVEVLAVRSGGHGSGEYGFNHEAMVRFERVTVGAFEGGAEFFRGVIEVVAKGLSCEVQPSRVSVRTSGKRGAEVCWVLDGPRQPLQTFSGSVFLLLQLVEHQILERIRDGWGRELAVTDFLFLLAPSP